MSAADLYRLNVAEAIAAYDRYRAYVRDHLTPQPTGAGATPTKEKKK
jgi:hypothetical protein